MSRRRVIVSLLGFSIIATLGGVLTPIVGYLWPPKRAFAGKGEPVQVGTAAEFPNGQGKVVPVNDKPVIVVRTEQEGVKAFSAILVLTRSSASPGKPPTLSHQSRTQVNERITQRAFSVLKLWEIVEVLNQQTDRDSLLFLLGKEILNRLEMTAVLIAVVDDRGVHVQHTLGTIPPSTNPEAYLGQRNPLRQSLQASIPADSGQADADPNIFVPDLSYCPEWNTSPLLQALKARGFICLSFPIDDGGKTQAVLSKRENPSGVESNADGSGP